jgi:hypothetical protein
MAGVKGRSGGARPGSGQKRRDPKASWLAGSVVKPAPHAIAERTLEPRTVVAFLLLCQNIVLERKLATAPLTCAGPDHRGLLARVEVGMARFRLAPDGKPVVGEEPKDEWAEFDGLTVVNGGKA